MDLKSIVVYSAFLQRGKAITKVRLLGIEN